MKRVVSLSGVGLLVIILVVLYAQTAHSTTPKSPPPENLLQTTPLPIRGWVVCRDLGIGRVPGLPDPRQRFRLCHPDGWELLAYCLQPNLPAPTIGTLCTRTGERTFFCGEGLQELREYRVQETPTPVFTPTPSTSPTPSPTTTSTPTATPTITPTPTSTTTASPSPTAPTATPTPTTTATPVESPTPTNRPPPGGGHYLDWLTLPFWQKSTPTPFAPLPLTPSPEKQVFTAPLLHKTSPPPHQPAYNFFGIDFNDASKRIRIRIKPTSKRVNGGRPLVIAFYAGQTCSFGDQRACIGAYSLETGADLTFISVHSGVGGAAQAFRHAIEGTWIYRAAYSPRQIRNNLRSLNGAEVTISQGDLVLEGFELAVITRLPAKSVQDYIHTPASLALPFAAAIDPALMPFIKSEGPLLVFETCGWRILGERHTPGTSNTSAAIYLGVIRKRP